MNFPIECGGFKSIMVYAQGVSIFYEMTQSADDLDTCSCTSVQVEF